jgi:hypothetical protein
LAKGKIAAQHRNSILGEIVGDGYEQRRFAIPSGSVAKNQAIVAVSGTMKKAADARLARSLLVDWFHFPF